MGVSPEVQESKRVRSFDHGPLFLRVRDTFCHFKLIFCKSSGLGFQFRGHRYFEKGLVKVFLMYF